MLRHVAIVSLFFWSTLMLSMIVPFHGIEQMDSNDSITRDVAESCDATVPQVATFSLFVQLFKHQRRADEDVAYLFNRISRGKLDLKALQQYGDNYITLVSRKGRSLLHAAAQGGKLDIVAYLLTKLNPNGRTKEMATPLHIAAEKGDLALVRFLVKSGCNIRAIDVKKETPWEKAQKCDKGTILEFITQWRIEQCKTEDKASCFICLDDDFAEKNKFVLCDYGCLTPICLTCKKLLTTPNCPVCMRVIHIVQKKEDDDCCWLC